MIEQEWKRRHIYNPYNPKGGVTLLYTVEQHFTSGFEIKYKYSVCSHKDNYNRKKGVLVATNKPIVECEILAKSYGDVVSAILYDIVASSHGDGIKQPIKDIMAEYLKHKATSIYQSEMGMIDFHFDQD